MPSKLYLITTYTSMHVGSKTDAGFGVIDKTIQRDRNSYPYISVDSLRGAIKEHFKENRFNSIQLEQIFGKDNGDGGALNFDDAFLLSLASSNDYGYGNLFSLKTLKKLQKSIEFWEINYAIDISAINNLSASAHHFENNDNKITLESKRIVATKTDKTLSNPLKAIIGDYPIWVNNNYTSETLKGYDNDLFKVLCDDYHLRKESHNSLLNGVSQNLWYEQVIDADSRFFFVVHSEDTVLFSAFDEFLKTHWRVQIGAHGTSSKGYCKIELLTP